MKIDETERMDKRDNKDGWPIEFTKKRRRIKSENARFSVCRQSSSAVEPMYVEAPVTEGKGARGLNMACYERQPAQKIKY